VNRIQFLYVSALYLDVKMVESSRNQYRLSYLIACSLWGIAFAGSA